MESLMKPQAIDNSAAIFSAQKIREVNYKYRKRKVDQDREKAENEPNHNQSQNESNNTSQRSKKVAQNPITNYRSEMHESINNDQSQEIL